jgi:hypothetical protein
MIAKASMTTKATHGILRDLRRFAGFAILFVTGGSAS